MEAKPKQNKPPQLARALGDGWGKESSDVPPQSHTEKKVSETSLKNFRRKSRVEVSQDTAAE